MPRLLPLAALLPLLAAVVLPRLWVQREGDREATADDKDAPTARCGRLPTHFWADFTLSGDER